MSDFNPIYETGDEEANNQSNDTFDFAMPDIPEPTQEEKVEIKDKDAVGFKFGFIGAGQGGDRKSVV